MDISKIEAWLQQQDDVLLYDPDRCRERLVRDLATITQTSLSSAQLALEKFLHAFSATSESLRKFADAWEAYK